MNLKKKLIKLTKEITTNDKYMVDNAINTAINKLGKVAGMKEVKDFNNSNKTYLYVKSASYSFGTMVAALNDKFTDEYRDAYRIYDNESNLKYTSECNIGVFTDKDKIILFDSKQKKVGYVRENYFAVGVPFLEKDVKKCEVYLGEKCVCKLKKYIEFRALHFETLEGKMHISFSDSKKFEYKIKRGNKIISVANELPINFVKGYTDKYVLEYRGTESDDEILAVLMTIALDKIK